MLWRKELYIPSKGRYSPPMLYIIGTPIGNLQDMTPRALEALKSVDIIACEDTRRARILLTHFGITGKRLLAHHSGNEHQSAAGLVKLIQDGQTMAYISDGGMPTISDPGYLLVKACLEDEIEVLSIGGVTAASLALSACGLPASRHLFAGFLPRKTSEQSTYFTAFFEQNLATALVFYESPKRILKTLKTLELIAPDAPCCVARELTKAHEEFIRGTVASVAAMCEAHANLKGEVTVVIAKP